MNTSHSHAFLKNVFDERHLAALKWFQDNAGKEVPWPKPLNGMFLVNKAKGIHKPAELSYALSVRQSLTGPYTDAFRVTRDGWALEYNQEGSDKDYFTNRALLACFGDAVPVGVMIQVKPKPSPLYKVLGLGNVIDFKDGSFTIQQYDKSPHLALEVMVSGSDFVVADTDDARRKELRSIAIRRGQPTFRKHLLVAYQGKCAVTGCMVQDVLEAAHIIPYKGGQTNHVQNGLLLRADIHTLFDLGMLWVDPETFTVEIAVPLLGSDYAKLAGKRLLLPSEPTQRPSRDALAARAALFSETRQTELMD